MKKVILLQLLRNQGSDELHFEQERTVNNRFGRVYMHTCVRMRASKNEDYTFTIELLQIAIKVEKDRLDEIICI